MDYMWLFESIGEINVIDLTNSATEDLCLGSMMKRAAEQLRQHLM
jgi:hypothetical protein